MCTVIVDLHLKYQRIVTSVLSKLLLLLARRERKNVLEKLPLKMVLPCVYTILVLIAQSSCKYLFKLYMNVFGSQWSFSLRFSYSCLEIKLALVIPISGRVEKASTAETVDTGSVSGRVEPKTIKIALQSIPARRSAIKGSV